MLLRLVVVVVVVKRHRFFAGVLDDIWAMDQHEMGAAFQPLATQNTRLGYKGYFCNQTWPMLRKYLRVILEKITICARHPGEL